MTKLYVDVDNTICAKRDSSYECAVPNVPVINKLNSLRETEGVEVILYTSRNMRSFDQDISKINLKTLPIILKWCEENHLKVDGIIMAKPYGGEDYFFVDDRALRPAEFEKLSVEEIKILLEKDKFK